MKEGDRYDGNWNEDIQEGFGIYYDKNNNVVLSGIWKEGIFQN